MRGWALGESHSAPQPDTSSAAAQPDLVDQEDTEDTEDTEEQEELPPTPGDDPMEVMKILNYMDKYK